MKTERRTTERIKGHIRIGYGPNKVCVSDLTDDLSPKGLFLRTPYPLDEGTLLKIEIHYQFKPKDKVKVLNLEGMVKRIQKDQDKSGMGIEFLNISPEIQDSLFSIINRLPPTEA